MSLLANQTYANPAVPLWMSVNGGVVDGSLTVDGAVTAGSVTSSQQLGSGVVALANATGVTIGGFATSTVASAPANDMLLQVNGGNKMRFGRTGTQAADTTFTPGVAGSNQDNLTVGGNLTAVGNLNGIGPNPVSLINTPRTISPAPVSPAAAIGFAVDTNVPTAVGQEFDVMARGIIALTGGVADPDDIVNVQLDAGTVGGVWTYQFKPSSVGSNGNWQIRDRIVSDAVTVTLFIAVQVLRAGASTADYSVSLLQLDSTRVK